MSETVTYIIIGVVLFTGSALQALVGFGYGLFAIPVLLVAGLQPQAAIAMVAVAVIFHGVLSLWKMRHEKVGREIWVMVAIGLAMQPIGTWVLGLLTHHLNKDTIGQVFGGLLLASLAVRAWLRPEPREFLAPIYGILSQITAAHLPNWDGSVKCMQSMLFVKPPGFQGQAWHQDEIYIPTRDRSLVGAWIAIDDANVENGCLWILPGSHRMGYLYPQRAHSNADEFDFAPESFGFDESKEIPVEVKAGAMVFFNGYLLHRSRRNRRQVYRRVLVNHYMNAWSHLPWGQLREGEHPAMADRRCIVPVAGIDPYAWKGYEAPKKDVWLRSCKANEGKKAGGAGYDSVSKVEKK